MASKMTAADKQLEEYHRDCDEAARARKSKTGRHLFLDQWEIDAIAGFAPALMAEIAEYPSAPCTSCTIVYDGVPAKFYFAAREAIKSSGAQAPA